jgi:hypothetical protein
MSRISRSVRGFVRERAGYRCEYCRKPELGDGFKHQVDHIISIKLGGSSSPENLCWACVHCNAFKSSIVSGYDSETGQLFPLYNPRLQQWDDHFWFDGPMIQGITNIGRLTIQVLRLNDEQEVQIRQQLMDNGQW